MGAGGEGGLFFLDIYFVMVMMSRFLVVAEQVFPVKTRSNIVLLTRYDVP